MLTCLLVAACFVCSACAATGVTVGFPVRVAPMAHVCQRHRHHRRRPMLSVACKHEGATNIHCSPRVCDLIWGFTMDMAAQGMAVLVTYNAAAPVCPYFTIVQAAAAAGATTVVFAMSQGQPYINLNCNGTAQCNTALGVSASVIDYAAGQALQNAIAAAPPGTVNVSIVNNKTSGFYFGIDHRGQLVQVVRIVLGSWVAVAVALSTCSERCSRVCMCVCVCQGWEKYPWMRILSWEAQWLEYTQELYTNLTKPALTVPIFGPTIMKGDPGVVVNVTLPPMAELIKYSNMELDMALGCPGTVDSQCPIWDHTVQLFVCCNGEVGSPAQCLWVPCQV